MQQNVDEPARLGWIPRGGGVTFPHNGGGNGGERNPGRSPPRSLFIFFYPVRVRNFGSKLGLGIRFHCVFRSPDLDLKALEDLSLIPLLRSKRSSRVRSSGFSLL